MTTSLATPPKLQFFDLNGAPLSGGKLYTYVAGTTTPQVTYTDYVGGTANTNPVILDSRGEASVWLNTPLYKMALYSATDVLIWTVDNIGGFATLAQLAASGGSNLIGFLQAGTGAVATTVQAKLRESVSIRDYGASPTASAAVNTAAIQQCINENSVIYIPTGTYQINGPITINSASVSGGQRTIYGDSRERSVIQATTANSRLENNVLRHDAIILSDFTFDGNNIATGGVSLGVNASVGILAASSADILSNFRVVRCVNAAVVMNYCQYFVIENCLFGGTTDGFGLYLNECGSGEINTLLTTSNKTAMFIGGTNGGTNPGGFSASSYIAINNWRAYGPYSGAAEGYLYITNAHHLTFNNCAFEHEIQHTTPLVWIRRTSTTVTSDIVFNYCDWQGLAFNTDLIEVSYCRRAIFNGCSAIRPNPGYYVLKSTGAGSNSLVYLNDCLANSTYSDFNTTYWKQGGYTTGSNVFEIRTLGNQDINFETGTWNATLTDGTNNATMAAFTCNFVKIGRQVTVSGNVSTSSLGSVTGDISIAGLPFPISGFAAATAGYASGLNITAGQAVTLLANNSGSSLNLFLWDSAAGTTWMQASEWSANGGIILSMTYTTTA